MTETRPAAEGDTSDAERLGVVAVGLGVVFWAIGPVLVKGVDVEGLAFAFHRSWIGALLFGAVLYLRGGRLRWVDLWHSRWGILALAADLGFFFSAVKLTTVANAVVISALQPAIVMLVVGPLFGERVRPSIVGWTAVSFVGVVLVTFGSASEVGWNLAGDLLAVGAVFAWAAYFVASKEARRHVGALEYQVALFVGCAVVMAPVALLSGQTLRVSEVSDGAGVVAMAAIAGLGHALINWAHAHVRLTITSLMTLGLPVVSTVGAWLFVDEPLVPVQVLGMAVVLLALAVVVTRPAPAGAGSVPSD